MITILYNGIKRLLYGATSVFGVRNGSAAFSGSSFVQVYKERTKFPLHIIGIKFAVSPDALGEWRICVEGIGKVFPFSEVNPMDSDFHNIIPIEIAAGSLFCIEVRSRNPQQKGIVILEELDVVEMR